MRKSKTQKLGDVLKEYVDANRIGSKLNELDLVDSWEKVMGRPIAKATSKIYIRNRTLFVHLTSSIIRNELFMMRERLRDALNEQVGVTVIDQVILK